VSDVIDRDKGYAKFIRRILGSEKVSVKVGVLTDEQHEGSSKSVAEIAEIHEMGLGVPARPWLRPIVDGNRGVINQRIKRAAQLVATGGMTNVDAMDLVGQSIVNDVRARIRAGIPPELAASTLRQKGEGKTTPLIASGQFIGIITHEVRDRGRQASREDHQSYRRRLALGPETRQASGQGRQASRARREKESQERDPLEQAHREANGQDCEPHGEARETHRLALGKESRTQADQEHAQAQ
jgi:hypothetical protein